MLVENGINQLIPIIDIFLHQALFSALPDLQWPESQVEILLEKSPAGVSLLGISTEKTKNSYAGDISLSLTPTDWVF